MSCIFRGEFSIEGVRCSEHPMMGTRVTMQEGVPTLSERCLWLDVFGWNPGSPSVWQMYL